MKDIKCNKTILIGVVILFTVLVLTCCYLFIIPSNGNVIIESGKSNQFVSTNSLTMMYETEAGSGEYQVSNDTTWPQDGYTFNETLSKCENGSKLTWDDENKKVLLQAHVSDKCYVYFDIVPKTLESVCNDGDNLSSCLKNFQSEYDETITNLYLHDETLENGANDGNYRYAGINPNNYICFGSSDIPCSEDNLYRIIGVFEDCTKLIKADYISDEMIGTTSYVSDYVSTYGNSNNYKGNKQQTNITTYKHGSTGVRNSSITSALNTDFFNIIYDDTSIITSTSWNSGSISDINLNIKDVFDNEVTNNEVHVINLKIGLMYISDYAYATVPDNWDTTLANYNEVANDNWLYMGLNEWTFTSSSLTYPYGMYIITDSGDIEYNDDGNAGAVRPVFYLSDDVIYKSGNGSIDNPIIISDTVNRQAIQFSIWSSVTFSAIEDMTWGEWIDSDYADYSNVSATWSSYFPLKHGVISSNGYGLCYSPCNCGCGGIHRVRDYEVINSDVAYGICD